MVYLPNDAEPLSVKNEENGKMKETTGSNRKAQNSVLGWKNEGILQMIFAPGRKSNSPSENSTFASEIGICEIIRMLPEIYDFRKLCKELEI